jgi:hypothetical protein
LGGEPDPRMLTSARPSGQAISQALDILNFTTQGSPLAARQMNALMTHAPGFFWHVVWETLESPAELGKMGNVIELSR